MRACTQMCAHTKDSAELFFRPTEFNNFGPFLIKYLDDLDSRDILQRHFCVKKFLAPDGENFEISSDVEDKSGLVTYSDYFGVEKIRYRIALQSF